MIKNKIRSLVSNLGWDFRKATEISEIEKFIQDYHPVRNNFPLLRIGNRGDGGYILPDDLEELSACFSPGVGTVVSFESEIAKLGIPVYLADGSINSSPEENPLFSFEPKFLMDFESANSFTLKSWMTASEKDHGDFLLQMDIEGHEYKVIQQTDIEDLKKFRIIVVEFHNLDYLLNPWGFEIISSAIRKILREFNIIYLHPNNCCGSLKVGRLEIPRVMEFTFHRKDRGEVLGFNIDLPSKLDAKNVDRKAELRLPKCWLGHK